MPRSSWWAPPTRTLWPSCATATATSSSIWSGSPARRSTRATGGTSVSAGRYRPGPRVLILVENLSVPFDRRVWQECCALTEAGYRVEVICPQGTKHDTEPFAEIGGVRIHRYPLKAATGGPVGYVREYGTALW